MRLERRLNHLGGFLFLVLIVLFAVEGVVGAKKLAADGAGFS